MFGYSKQAYYKSYHQISNKTQRSENAKKMVMYLRREMPRIGTRKLHYMLKDSFEQQQIRIGRDGLFALLRKEGMLVHKIKRYTKTTNSKHWLRKYPNLIKGIEIIQPEQLWVADITYIDSLDGFNYLHLVTDAYSKQIMGFELCDNMESVSTIKALEMALINRKYPDRALIHHSDRGLQYCSKRYTDKLLNSNIKISMTENGDPYENAIAERVNGILKDEFGLGERFESISQCFKQTKESINIYNNRRPHNSCQMLTPVIMHQQDKVKLKTWHKKRLNTFECV